MHSLRMWEQTQRELPENAASGAAYHYYPGGEYHEEASLPVRDIHPPDNDDSAMWQQIELQGAENARRRPSWNYPRGEYHEDGEENGQTTSLSSVERVSDESDGADVPWVVGSWGDHCWLINRFRYSRGLILLTEAPLKGWVGGPGGFNG